MSIITEGIKNVSMDLILKVDGNEVILFDIDKFQLWVVKGGYSRPDVEMIVNLCEIPSNPENIYQGRKGLQKPIAKIMIDVPHELVRLNVKGVRIIRHLAIERGKRNEVDLRKILFAAWLFDGDDYGTWEFDPIAEFDVDAIAFCKKVVSSAGRKHITLEAFYDPEEVVVPKGLTLKERAGDTQLFTQKWGGLYIIGIDPGLFV